MGYTISGANGGATGAGTGALTTNGNVEVTVNNPEVDVISTDNSVAITVTEDADAKTFDLSVIGGAGSGGEDVNVVSGDSSVSVTPTTQDGVKTFDLRVQGKTLAGLTSTGLHSHYFWKANYKGQVGQYLPLMKMNSVNIGKMGVVFEILDRERADLRCIYSRYYAIGRSGKFRINCLDYVNDSGEDTFRWDDIVAMRTGGADDHHPEYTIYKRIRRSDSEEYFIINVTHEDADGYALKTYYNGNGGTKDLQTPGGVTLNEADLIHTYREPGLTPSEISGQILQTNSGQIEWADKFASCEGIRFANGLHAHDFGRFDDIDNTIDIRYIKLLEVDGISNSNNNISVDFEVLSDNGHIYLHYTLCWRFASNPILLCRENNSRDHISLSVRRNPGENKVSVFMRGDKYMTDFFTREHAYISVISEGANPHNFKYASIDALKANEFLVECVGFAGISQYNELVEEEHEHPLEIHGDEGIEVSVNRYGVFDLSTENVSNGVMLDRCQRSKYYPPEDSPSERKHLAYIPTFNQNQIGSYETIAGQIAEFEILSPTGDYYARFFIQCGDSEIDPSTNQRKPTHGSYFCTCAVNFDLNNISFVGVRNHQTAQGDSPVIGCGTVISVPDYLDCTINVLKGNIRLTTPYVYSEDMQDGVHPIFAPTCANEEYLTQSEYEALSSPDTGKTYYIYEDTPEPSQSNGGQTTPPNNGLEGPSITE